VGQQFQGFFFIIFFFLVFSFRFRGNKGSNKISEGKWTFIKETETNTNTGYSW
jgi:hypothetical protein